MISPNWESLHKRKGANLPHWNCGNAIYHVCFRLADSIPQAKLEQWNQERKLFMNLKSSRLCRLTSEEKNRYKFLLSKNFEDFLDAGYGECLLKNPKVAEIVKESLEYFDGERYKLHAWCIMPNHVHVIVEPVAGFQLSEIIHSWKSFSAHQINKILNRQGKLWQHEPYDHIIRSETEYWEQIEYVWNNPVKGGVDDCPRWRVDKEKMFGES